MFTRRFSFAAGVRSADPQTITLLRLMLRRRYLALPLLALALLAGCGVQEGGDADAAACAEAEAFFEIKTDADALDREIIDRHPTQVTLATVRALAPRYSDASEQYGGFHDRAEAELERARSDDSDFVAVWDLVVESMAVRRDGMAFFAETFANPESLQDPAVGDESDEWGRKTNDVNARLKESSSRWMRDHGFEETDDGNVTIDC